MIVSFDTIKCRKELDWYRVKEKEKAFTLIGLRNAEKSANSHINNSSPAHFKEFPKIYWIIRFKSLILHSFFRGNPKNNQNTLTRNIPW